MKIILLGANGFVGTNVANVLHKAGVTFIPVSRTHGLDLKNYIETYKIFSTVVPDVVINCAAHVGSLNYVSQQAADIITDNSTMILNMYKAIAEINPAAIVINPIANCAYPALDEKFSENDMWKGPVHPSVFAYGNAKRFLLSIAKSYEMQHGLKSIQLLVPNMYGPHDSTDPNKAHALNALVSRFVKAEKSGINEITLWGTGVAIREWLFAEDFGKIVLQIIQNLQMVGLSEPLNIAQNFGLSINELVNVIQALFENKFTIKWDAAMPNGAPKKVMDDAKFRKLFPEFRFADFNNGIAQTINYYQNKFPY